MSHLYSVTLIFETAKSANSDLNWHIIVEATDVIRALRVAKENFRKVESLSFRKLWCWNIQ